MQTFRKQLQLSRTQSNLQEVLTVTSNQLLAVVILRYMSSLDS
jgi:hypothetical protein